MTLADAMSAAYGKWLKFGGWTDAEAQELGTDLAAADVDSQATDLEPVEIRCHVSRIHLRFLRDLQRLRV